MRQGLNRWLAKRPALRRMVLGIASPAANLWSAWAPAQAHDGRRIWPWNLGNVAGPGVGKAAPGRHVIMLVVSDVSHDPRLRHSALALAGAGYAVTIIAPHQAGIVTQLPDWGTSVAFEMLPWQAGAFSSAFPGFVGTALCAAALRHAPFAFYAHDLTTGLAACAAARNSGAHLIVDFHEWMSQTAFVDHGGRCLPISHRLSRARRWLENKLLREASACITVCQPIVDAMALQAKTKPPYLIRNMPDFGSVVAPQPSLRTTLGLGDEQTLILYQGGIGPTRNLGPVIRALAHAPACVLAIRGRGLDVYGAHYAGIARAVGAADRLRLLPAVQPEAVVAACHGADVGLYTVLGICRNAILAAPNKVFEYLAAGLPVLAADYPGVSPVISDHQVGLVFDPDNPVAIGAAMSRMAEDRGFRQACAARARAALATFQGADEWAKLVSIVDELPRMDAGSHG
jgi:glycosyltransferase involved in cell wall biosynthesis